MPATQPTTQISVRVPTELIEWLDKQVAEDLVASRAAGVTKALRRMRRRQEAERDLAILLAAPPDPDEESRLQWTETRDYPDMGEPAGVLDPAEINRVAELVGLQPLDSQPPPSPIARSVSTQPRGAKPSARISAKSATKAARTKVDG